MDKFKFEFLGRLKKHENEQQAATAAAQPQGTQDFRIPEARQTQSQQNIPIDAVRELTSQGLSEADIIKKLKLKNYSFSQIDQALNTVLKSGIDNRGVTHLGVINNIPAQRPQQIMAPQPPQMQQPPQRMDNRIEAHIETIIEERLESLKSIISSIENDLEKVHEQIENLDTSMKQLESRSEETSDNLSQKFEALDEKFDDMNPKIASIEKAFKDVIPNIIDNVRELTEIVKKDRPEKISIPGIDTAEPETGKIKDNKEPEENLNS